LLRRLLVAPPLHEHIKHIAVLIDSTLQIMPLTLNGQEDFIEVPLVPWSGASAA
jgi:hypothetical protein